MSPGENVGTVFLRCIIDSRSLQQSFQSQKGLVQREGMALGKVFRGAFSVGLGIGISEAVRQGFRAIVGESINFNAQMEQARIGFTTMLGSAQQAGIFLKDLSRFAARTPFEFPELLDASKRMLAMGFAAGEVLPMMEAVGNAAAGLGLGRDGINRITLALGQMRAKAKVSGEEMRQLTEAGVPAWEILAEAMGKSTAEVMKLSERGLIPANEAIQMLTEGMNRRFPDMMKNMENTWEGITSTIKDVWRLTIGELTSGWFNGLKTWLQGVRDWAVDFYNVLQSQGLRAALTHSFGAEFTSAVYLAGSVLRGFYNILVYVVALVRRHWQLIKFAGTAMLTYAAATKAAAAATSLFVFAQQLLSGNLTVNTGLLGFLNNVIVYYRVLMLEAGVSTNIFTGALMRLRAALYAVHTALGPIGWVLIGLSLLVAGGLHLWNKYVQSLQKTPKVSGEVEDSTKAVSNALKDQTQALKETGKAAAKTLLPFDEIHRLNKEIAGTDYLDAIQDALEGVGTGISMPAVDFDEFLEGLEDVKPTFRGFLAWIWDEWTSTVQSWGWVQSLSGWIVDTFFDEATGKWSLSKAWGKWETWVQEWSKPFSDWVVDIISSLNNVKQNFATKFKEIKDSVLTRFSEIKSNLATRWSEIKTNTLTRISEIKTGISTKFNEIKNNISTKINEVKTKLSGTWNSIKNSAGSAWDGIKNSIRGAINSIIGYINKFIKGFNKIKIEIPSVTLPFYGKVGGWSLKLPQISEIPTLARGGIIDQPTLAMIGERGKKEAVLPLEQNTGWMDTLAAKIAAVISGQGGGGVDGDRPIIINLSIDKSVLGKVTAKSLRELQRQSGVTVIPV